jgi:hypothetical protein
VWVLATASTKFGVDGRRPAVRMPVSGKLPKKCDFAGTRVHVRHVRGWIWAGGPQTTPFDGHGSSDNYFLGAQNQRINFCSEVTSESLRRSAASCSRAISARSDVQRAAPQESKPVFLASPHERIGVRFSGRDFNGITLRLATIYAQHLRHQD